LKDQVEEIDDIEKESFFLIIQNPLIWGDSKIVLTENFGGFWEVYMNSSNLIYVVIILLMNFRLKGVCVKAILFHLSYFYWRRKD